MDEKCSSFVEKIGNVTYVVNVHSADDAKHTKQEYVKRLIAEKAMAFTEDVA